MSLAPRIVNIRSTKKTRYRRFEGNSPLNNSSRKKEKKTEGIGSSLFQRTVIEESLRNLACTHDILMTENKNRRPNIIYIDIQIFHLCKINYHESTYFYNV